MKTRSTRLPTLLGLSHECSMSHLEVNALLGDHLGASRDLTVDTVGRIEHSMKRLEANMCLDLILSHLSTKDPGVFRPARRAWQG